MEVLTHPDVLTNIEAAHAIAQNKGMIIDGGTVITASFNFTEAAQEQHAENVLIIRDKALAAQYTQSWQTHAEHAERDMGRGVVR